MIRHFEDYVFEVPDFVSAGKCDLLMDYAEQIGFEEALIGQNQVRREHIRNNDRVLNDDPALAQEMWAQAEQYVPKVFKGRESCGLNERIRFYRYDPGQKFDWHLDGYFERENGERSQYTFMVYLNEGCEGGGTSFRDVSGRLFDRFTVVPKKGSALFFYHHLEHRGDPVTAGRKYVMRTDVMYSPLQNDVSELRKRSF